MTMGDSNSKEIIINTELGEVVVHKMPLSDYAELLRALNMLPEKVGQLIGKDLDFAKMGNAEIFKLLPEILADSWNDLAGLIAVPTNKSAEEILKLDGADAIDVIDAILELNDFARIANSVKKMLARRAKTEAPKSQ